MNGRRFFHDLEGVAGFPGHWRECMYDAAGCTLPVPVRALISITFVELVSRQLRPFRINNLERPETRLEIASRLPEVADLAGELLHATKSYCSLSPTFFRELFELCIQSVKPPDRCQKKGANIPRTGICRCAGKGFGTYLLCPLALSEGLRSQA